METFIPCCYTRLWCRDHQSWLSFKTSRQDRFLVSPDGYFLELPDGTLTRISPRTCFPVVNNLPSLPLSMITPRRDLGSRAYFVGVPLRPEIGEEPDIVDIKRLQQDPLASAKKVSLDECERAILLRVLENGIITRTSLENILSRKAKTGESAGEILIANLLCQWESLLAQCLDVTSPAQLDPPVLRSMSERREWELIGEILVALDKINRTDLEYALKLKREAMPALGQILTAMGACRNEDVKRCLKIQRHVKQAPGPESIALIGSLLVEQKIISQSDLDEVLDKQQVSRQPLANIFLQMGVCTEKQIAEYGGERKDFSPAIDEAAFAERLLKANIVSRAQMQEAQRIQQRGRQVIGELLVAYNLCKREDVEELLSLQRDARDAYWTGLERLGSLLIAKAKVPPRFVEEALESQSLGRQPLGAVLVAVGACTAADVNLALDVQRAWRAQDRKPGDRLGELLVEKGVLTAEQLQQPLLQHLREEKPLGRLLVEGGICQPEAIIALLLCRDQKRQKDFVRFVEQTASKVQKKPDAVSVAPTPAPDGKKLLRKLNALSKARKGKD